METLQFDLSEKYGKFKPLNATNGGPWHRRNDLQSQRSNLETYRAARIPYSRNHDSEMIPIYGGPYSHDITRIFPRFDADPCDPASYDFACTDEDILVCLEAGTKVFFRLGESIEHQIKKHATLPPKDFMKWAVICEHVVRHYTEGWADGFHHDMEYWEIWNEPDLDEDDSPNKRTWGGDRATFFVFYEMVAKYLKKCFPQLKFGGPALSGNEQWAEKFLQYMNDRNVPIDFFSWHIYTCNPQEMREKAVRIKTLLVKYGYGNAESILNEWNYMRNFGDGFLYSMRQMRNEKGAAFMMACMSLAQRAPIDMLMYYDTRMSAFNGIFDYYTADPLKGYYPFLWYGFFYDRKAEVRAVNEIADIYSICGVDEDGKVLAVITYYSDRDDGEDKKLSVDFGRNGNYEIYLLDGEHNGEVITVTDKPELDLKLHSVVLIREV